MPCCLRRRPAAIQGCVLMCWRRSGCPCVLSPSDQVPAVGVDHVGRDRPYPVAEHLAVLGELVLEPGVHQHSRLPQALGHLSSGSVAQAQRALRSARRGKADTLSKHPTTCSALSPDARCTRGPAAGGPQPRWTCCGCGPPAGRSRLPNFPTCWEPNMVKL